MDTLETLKAARNKIADPLCWTQEWFAKRMDEDGTWKDTDATSPSACCWCATGAIRGDRSHGYALSTAMAIRTERDEMKSKLELRVIQETMKCRHFHSAWHNPTCKAGVNFRELVGGPDLGWAIRKPCLPPSDRVDASEIVHCASRSTWTKEEAELNIREEEAWFDRSMNAINATHADAKAKNLGKDNDKKGVHGGGSELKCPACPEGVISYSVSGYNGHIHGKCTTNDCVSWME